MYLRAGQCKIVFVGQFEPICDEVCSSLIQVQKDLKSAFLNTKDVDVIFGEPEATNCTKRRGIKRKSTNVFLFHRS